MKPIVGICCLPEINSAFHLLRLVGFWAVVRVHVYPNTSNSLAYERAGCMSQQENVTVELPNASVRAGFLVGLDLCSQVLWKFAVKIKDDQSQGYSERLAIIKVLHLIHDEIKVEMEKFNGNSNQSTRVDGNSQERQQASK